MPRSTLMRGGQEPSPTRRKQNSQISEGLLCTMREHAKQPSELTQDHSNNLPWSSHKHVIVQMSHGCGFCSIQIGSEPPQEDAVSEHATHNIVLQCKSLGESVSLVKRTRHDQDLASGKQLVQ